MCVLKKLQYILPRKPLLRIYKSFIWPHLDYSDIIYGYPNNECFSPKIESYQYNAALAITRAIRGASLIKLYYELNLESLKFRRYFWRFCTFYKIQSSKLSPLMYKSIPQGIHFYSTIYTDKLETCYYRTDVLKNYFFRHIISE